MFDTSRFRQARLSRDPRFDGSFFVAVKTTKIFCRPICPANPPLEKNVEYFQLAQQAMQQGYRPCLRCHPDSAPTSNLWQGTDTTVKRASHLLHAHHELSVTEIANKLGIGERYLRDLFKRQLGISPKQFQLFDQLLFAKQLLHHSNLSVEQVAQSCGFSSARRLQIQLKKLTGLSPAQIRSRQNKVEQQICVSLPYRRPFAWQALRDFLAKRAIAGVEQIEADSYSRYVQCNGQVAWFKATIHEQEGCFKIVITLDDVTQLAKLLRNITRVLDLNADIQQINENLLASGLAKHQLVPGLRVPGVWDVFEAGCRAILGQQVSVTAAINLVTQLTQGLSVDSSLGLTFPTPQRVAQSDLTFLRIPQSRRQSLHALAVWCWEHPDASVDDWLAIKGIGPWTISYTKLRGLSAPDEWLNTDLVIKKQLEQYQINPELAAPWRSYLTLQLWNLA
jgi:AraC family transcriptional regulator, regulatory protein of adaptative response / DNA-3-methyladenine glycosylase II